MSTKIDGVLKPWGGRVFVCSLGLLVLKSPKKFTDPQTLMTAPKLSLFTLKSGMLSGSPHLKMSASHGLLRVSEYVLQVVTCKSGILDYIRCMSEYVLQMSCICWYSGFQSLTRIRLSSFPCSVCCLSCGGCRGSLLWSAPQTSECQRTKHHS